MTPFWPGGRRSPMLTAMFGPVLRFVVVCVLALAAPIAAQQPRHGLLFNRTGLPLTLPLQIKTDPGLDYALILADPQTDEAKLSAFIHGGKFFRLLVPPGTFRLHFAYGERWEGPEALFGPDTRYHTLPETFTFSVQGLATKQGFLIDLRDLGEEASLTVRHIGLCQTLDLSQDYIAWLKRNPVFHPTLDDVPDPAPGAFDIRQRFCEPA